MRNGLPDYRAGSPWWIPIGCDSDLRWHEETHQGKGGAGRRQPTYICGTYALRSPILIRNTALTCLTIQRGGRIPMEKSRK